MSNVVQFLETLGASPSHAANSGYANTVSALDVSADERRALLARDAEEINRLLGGRAAMRCMIVTPD